MRYLSKILFPLYLIFLFAVALPQEGTKPATEPEQIPVEIKMDIKIAAGIKEKMPIDVDSAFSASIGKVFCWCAVTGVKDTLTIYQVWNYQGQEQSRTPIQITSLYFRAYTYQNIKPEQTGIWMVYIIDAQNNVLGKTRFTIRPNEN